MLIKTFLKAIGFVLKDGESNFWYKKYSDHNDYEIIVKLKESLKDSKIDWGNKIEINRKTTSNLSQPETKVVLECVNRLLEKGYKPENLTLEKQWRLAGYLDVWVKDEIGKSYLMIECKTWGKEYVDTLKKTLNNTGKADKQIFGYLIQEPENQYLCLYTSKLNEKNEIEYKNSIIQNIDEFRHKNQIEIFEIWDKSFEKKGVFEENAIPFNVKFTELQKHELEDLNTEDGGLIFNQFAEILRRNTVSDKNNAFNKIFNLFLCKIVDEDKKRENDEMDFQWKKKYEKDNLQEENVGYKEFLGILNDLYKEGVRDYLQIEVTDHSRKEVENLLKMLPSTDEKTKSKIKEIIEDLRFYKSNEFAFKEVNNKETFEENAKIVKEVVELLQGYRIKYQTKHQFLGDFFENLLNTGIKQESGQFFTPTPIASFICKSLPIWNIIQNKNNNKEINFLPYMIDFASGSGHFLTEGMNEINHYVENKITNNWIKGGKRAMDEFDAGKNSYKWAKEYIYGIEKDYRLAKTTKISAFLNGDGDANVICGDGIGSFQYEKKYTGLLKSESDSRDNQKFDVLVANPPYSVDEFKITIAKHGAKSFELFEGLSDKASEIECLFIERAKQLLKDGGVAGIILPISILSNGKIHLRAREMILKYFEIKAIVEFGSNTFMATGTKTVAVFIKRRAINEWKIIKKHIDEFFENFKDISLNGNENIFLKYVKHVFEDLELKDYISVFSNNPNEKIMNREFIKEYKTYFKKLKEEKLIKAIKEAEKEKMLYFMLTYNQNFVIVKAPRDNSDEKEFLGYEFSTRRGHEGIKIYKDDKGKNLTKLYNAESGYLYDKDKVSSYILMAFDGKEIPEPSKELKSLLQIQKLHNSLDFSRVNFEKRITTEFSKKKVNFEKTWGTSVLINITEIADFQKGTSITKEKTKKGNIPVIAGGKELAYYHNESNRKGNIITVSASGANAGFVNHFDTEIFASDCTTIKSKNEKQIKTELLYWFLKNLQKEIYGLQRGQAQPHVYASDLINIKIPLISLNIQEKIMRELNMIVIRKKEIDSEIEKGKGEIEKIIDKVNTEKVTLGSIIDFAYGVSLPKARRVKGEYPVVGSNGIDGYHNEFLVKAPCIVIGRKGSAGKVNLIEENCTPIDTTFYARFDDDKLKYKFVYYLLKSLNLENLGGGVGVPGLNRNNAYSIKIPFPLVSEQEIIVKHIEAIEIKQLELEKKLYELDNSIEMVLKKHL